MEERKEKRRSRRQARLALHRRSVSLVLLICVVALAVLSLIAKDRPFSDNENRSLAQRPKVTLSSLEDGSFFDNYSDYLADQFFGRDRWISLDTFGTRLLGQRDVNGVFIGKSGYLFSAPETPDLDRQDAKIAAVNAFARRHEDLNIMFMLAPGAAAVMGSKLPANAPVRDQVADIQSVEAQLDGSIQVLDVIAALAEHSGEEIYYRTDHHWTSLGAYYAYASASDKLGQYMASPAFAILPVTDSFEGTLASRSGVHRVKDTINVYVPQGIDTEYYVNYPDTQKRVTSLFVSEALEQKDQYTVFFGGNHPVVEIHTTVDNGHSLLVFKDSYANCFMQFLTTYYDKIIMIDPRYYYDDLSLAISTYGITDVLFLYSADTWMTDSTLADVLATG